MKGVNAGQDGSPATERGASAPLSLLCADGVAFHHPIALARPRRCWPLAYSSGRRKRKRWQSTPWESATDFASVEKGCRRDESWKRATPAFVNGASELTLALFCQRRKPALLSSILRSTGAAPSAGCQCRKFFLHVPNPRLSRATSKSKAALDSSGAALRSIASQANLGASTADSLPRDRSAVKPA